MITIPEPPFPDLMSLLPSSSTSVFAVPIAPPLPPPHKAFCVIPFVLFPSVPPCFPSPFVPVSFIPEPPPPPPNQIVPPSKYPELVPNFSANMKSPSLSKPTPPSPPFPPELSCPTPPAPPPPPAP